jgi:MoaA/NifB/PqqE/SkfB family radical SAM enzyme
MPPFTDDRDEDPMFTLPQKEMMIEMNNLLVKYGLDTWIWYPLMHGDYSDKGNIDRSLEENESIFSQLTKVDAIFVPGGDPGHHIPKVLFAQLQRKAEVLHRYHPEAEIWVSPQGLSAEWFEEFLHLIKEEPE